MKNRNGFVSNSSSSSFVCAACGDAEAGMDASREDFEYVLCENGHELCAECKIEVAEPTRQQKLDRCIRYIAGCDWMSPTNKTDRVNEVTDNEDKLQELFDEISTDWGISSACCPICTFKTPDKDTLKYVLKFHGLTEKQMLKMIADRFGNDYTKFQEFLNS